MNLGLRSVSTIAAILNLGLLGSMYGMAQQQSAVPDAPAPQSHPSLSGLSGPITPGIGAGETSSEKGTSSSESAQPGQEAPAQPQNTTAPIISGAKDDFQKAAPELPASGEGMQAVASISVRVNFVEVPVTVKDSKGNLVAGLTWRDFKVFENDSREQLRLFTVDPAPLSVAFVIDQSLPSPVMSKVNDSLGAIQGALTPYDEIAVFSYNNGAQERTGFTGAQSQRVPAVMAMTKETGSDPLVPINSGPFASCGFTKNGNCVDPNIQRGQSTGTNGNPEKLYKEPHTLNDAILMAAKELSSRPRGRRRLIYVISDGKEQGSKASYRDVLRYLQTNKIAVYGTAVGDSARWGEGYLSRFHIPGMMYDNLLAKYVLETGGTLDSESSTNGIEKSYAKIAEEARTQYTLGYNSAEPMIDGKFRKIDVRVDRPGLEVIAKRGYFPSGQDVK